MATMEEKFAKKTLAHSSSSSSSSPSSSSSSLMSVFKTKVISAFTNFRYMQLFPPSFSPRSPVWVLGRIHSFKPLRIEELWSEEDEEEALGLINSHVLADLDSRTWITYRSGFPVIEGSRYTCDVGWGCMVRSAQMMLAEAFVRVLLKRDFQPFAPAGLNLDTEMKYRAILSLFADDPSAPFSIHNIVTHSEGRKAGDWFGPNSVSHAVAKLMFSRADQITSVLGQPFKIYVALDGLIAKDEMQKLIEYSNGVSARKPLRHPNSDVHAFDSGVKDVFEPVLSEDVNKEMPVERDLPPPISQDGGEPFWAPIIVVIPLRLGLDELSEVYYPVLQDALSYTKSIGIIGGKPRQSIYFLGFQDEFMIGLDPHCCQPAVDMTHPSFPISSFHCATPRKIPFSNLDPTLALGFVLDSPKALNDFYAHFTNVGERGLRSVFTICESRNPLPTVFRV